ncbi:gas vesicle protein [Streptomyces wuyuanensis]|uniref:gas vesicle protein n=1 Tax=Streptomyces wuyuanensis TaxID=1196353 RepID=UPI00371442D7
MSPRPSETGTALPDRQVALIDLLDRLLSGGVVLTGDVVLSIADIDLVRISLRALIMSIRSSADGGASEGGAFPGGRGAREGGDFAGGGDGGL